MARIELGLWFTRHGLDHGEDQTWVLSKLSLFVIIVYVEWPIAIYETWPSPCRRLNLGALNFITCRCYSLNHQANNQRGITWHSFLLRVDMSALFLESCSKIWNLHVYLTYRVYIKQVELGVDYIVPCVYTQVGCFDNNNGLLTNGP